MRLSELRYSKEGPFGLGKLQEGTVKYINEGYSEMLAPNKHG